MKQKAHAVFISRTVFFEIVDSDGLGWKLRKHLRIHAPWLSGDTHLAKFYRGDGPASGKLENSMPGSTFEHFEFERHTFGTDGDAVDVIVGWYW